MRGSGGWLKYGFVAPALAFLIAFNVFPLFYSLGLSFTNAELSGGATSWNGAANYRRVFEDARYAQALRTTGLFMVLATGLELALGFLLASALRPRFRGRNTLATLLLIPMMLSPAVMGLFWSLVLNGEYGILNQTLSALGLYQPQWINDPKWKLAAVLMIDVWMWTPFMLLLSLSALNSIPPAIYEAAEIDRASSWKVFLRITLPLAAPLLLLAVLFRATEALKQFDLVMALTGPNDEATQTLSALLYLDVFRNGRLGLGCAYSYVVLVLVLALAGVFTRYLGWLQKRRGKGAA
jgi:multiple sugar transport system permease protein